MTLSSPGMNGLTNISLIWYGCYINVQSCGGLSMVHASATERHLIICEEKGISYWFREETETYTEIIQDHYDSYINPFKPNATPFCIA